MKAPLDATSMSTDGGELEGAVVPVTDSPSPAPDSTSSSDASAEDAMSTNDAASPCSSGTATAQVNGASVQLTGCTVDGVDSGPGTYEYPVYEYLLIQCDPPRLSIRWNADGSASASFQDTPAGTAPVYSGNATVTITTLGPVGSFVEGTVAAPQLQAVQGGPTLALQGTFHACHRADAPDIGH
jgi:hypothetical protein